jgi:hypothetical protein
MGARRGFRDSVSVFELERAESEARGGERESGGVRADSHNSRGASWGGRNEAVPRGRPQSAAGCQPAPHYIERMATTAAVRSSPGAGVSRVLVGTGSCAKFQNAAGGDRDGFGKLD